MTLATWFKTRFGRPDAVVPVAHEPAAPAPATPTPVVTPPADRDGAFRSLLGAGNRLVAVDVGGAGELQPHWMKLRPVCDFIVYEPNDASFGALVSRQTTTPGYENFRYLNVGLAGQAGRRDLYVTNVPTGSSLRPVNPDGISSFIRSDYFFPLEVEQIEVETLAASLDGLRVGDVHAVKLDTQGTELEILQGLDAARTSSLLAFELEAGLLDHYVGDDTALQDVLAYARSKGFQLFDLRCNRFSGSAGRYDLDEMARLLGADLLRPPSAHRLNEVDAIFFRETRHFIAAKPDERSIRRFVALLCTYNFFMEALAALKYAAEVGLMSSDACEACSAAVKTIFAAERAEVEAARAALGENSSFGYAQYMWVPVPST